MRAAFKTNKVLSGKTTDGLRVRIAFGEKVYVRDYPVGTTTVEVCSVGLAGRWILASRSDLIAL
jgi:hypothetical protein